MRIRPVLVTGAAGFIGSHLARRLCADDWSVRALDMRPVPVSLRDTPIRYHRIDVRDSDAVRAIVDGVDTVFHLASAHLEVHAGPEHFAEVNVGAAAALAEACSDAGVRRLIHTSSVGVYGHVRHPPAAEDAILSPRSPYERSKVAGEQAVLDVAQRTGLDVIVLRPSWVYGPGCSRTAKLLRSLARRKFLFIGDGSNLRHPLFIEDLLDAFELAGNAPSEFAGRVYNVAGPLAMPLREMVAEFARAVGMPLPRRQLPPAVGWMMGRVAEVIWGMARREPPFSRRSLSFFESDNSFDTEAIRRDLGFVPRFDLEAGLRHTLMDPARAVAA